MKKLLLLLPVLALALAGWLYSRRSAPLSVPFALAARETLISTLITNGKVEPLEWAPVLAERTGVIETLRVQVGSRVARGDVVAELSAQDAKSDLAAAEARLTQARAELQVLEQGGRASDRAALDGEVAGARAELAAEEKERAAFDRLAEKQAATKQEAADAARRVERAQLQIQVLEKKRAALVGQADKVSAQAKVREAETGVEMARRRVVQAAVQAPIGGVVYDVGARVGAYLNPGDQVAKVGQTDKVRVRVYVDEPELGRVAAGMPVIITWDALPGRKWHGAVERLPSAIAALGSRQVGEVACVIENPGRELPPGANVNAEIRSRVAQGALSIPREALHRQGSETGVFLLQGQRIVWCKVTLGVSTINRAQVLEGLAEGDAVALPSDATLTNGAAVKPVLR
jgi:HlyD family secretion protein